MKLLKDILKGITLQETVGDLAVAVQQLSLDS